MKSVTLYAFNNKVKLIAFVITLFIALPGHSRILPTGIGAKTTLAGNGLSASTAFTIQYASSRWEFELGADMQMRKPHFSGTQATLYYYPMRTNIRGLRLGFFSNVHYNFSAYMNKSVIAQESFLAPENRVNFEQLTMRTIEGQLGFMLRVMHTQDLGTFYGVGFGAYHTLGSKEDYPLIHREINHVQLVLNIGINYNIRRN